MVVNHESRYSDSGKSQVLPKKNTPFEVIGERLNTLGSRRFKQLILDHQYSEILPIAQKQITEGAKALDVCVALTERDDEIATMSKVIETLAPAVNIPLVIDSTRLEVMKVALQAAQGQTILNSTNLEQGQERADEFFKLARHSNAAVIALTIDERGMAKNAEEKLEIARRLLEIGSGKHQLDPHNLIIDALTFTLSIGDPDYANSAQETLEAVRLIKHELPGVRTSLGISNVSFGFPPEIRKVVNNVMLNLAVQKGLDMAIVNPAQILPLDQLDPDEIELAENLIHNRSGALLNIVSYYRKLRKMKKNSLG